MNELWNLQGEPLRPPQQVVESIVSQASSGRGGSVIMLGVTPEYHGRFSSLTAIDSSIEMVNAVWPGNTARDSVKIGDWLNLSRNFKDFDRLIGDFSLGVVGGKSDVMMLLSSIRNICGRGGVCLFRIWTRPEVPITKDSIIDFCNSEEFTSHAVRLRIGMHLAQENEGVVPVSKIFERFNDIFPSRRDFVSMTRVNPDELKLLDVYKESDSVYFFPRRSEIIKMASEHEFIGDFLEVGGYAFSEDCPILKLWL